MRPTALVALFLALACASPRSHPAAPPGRHTLAVTPPMGWNSWNHFHCDVDETIVRETADALVATGMRDAGYRYLVVDDCWAAWTRDAHGRLRADPTRFPSGIAALAHSVHARGLAFGLYSDAGRETCQGRPGSNGHEETDARQWARWGVDYLKYDWCHTEGVDPRIAYVTMRDALRAAGRPVVFSMCEWGNSSPWTWARGVAQLWRTTGDILPCWDCATPPGGLAWPKILDREAPLARFAGPGGWNDADMLQVGNEGMTVAESRAHFSLWCMLAAPLMAGNDVRAMPDDIRAVLLNRDAIAIDQDRLGVQGWRLRRDRDGDVWVKPVDGGWAVVLFNRGTRAAAMTIRWRELGLDTAPAVRDVWAGRDLGRVAQGFTATVPPRDVAMLRLTD